MAKYQEYRKILVSLVKSIEMENGLEEENAVLILYSLDSVERISKFVQWLETKMEGEKLQATEEEICRAAVKISKGLNPLEDMQ